MMSDLDKFVLDQFQKVFDEIEYRWGFTTAQIAELCYMIVWPTQIVYTTMKNEEGATALAAFFFILLLALTYVLRMQDNLLRSNRRVAVEAMVQIRERWFFKLIRLMALFNAVQSIFTLILVSRGWGILHEVSMIVNFAALYFFYCLDDVDGEKRKRMEKEAAEKELQRVQEHA